MAAPGAAMQDLESMEASGVSLPPPSEPIPGYPDIDTFVKHALGTVVAATKASTGLPQSGDEYDFYRSFPGFRAFCDSQGNRLLGCMSQVMQYHGCRSHIRDRSKVGEMEDKFDLLVDANDAVLEKVGMLLDEVTGVARNKQPILPAGLQAPKTIISSWNRKGNDLSKKGKSETFRLLHAKNIQRPQMKFKERLDNSNTPFIPKIFVKPNAQRPLPDILKNRLDREQRPEDLDVPPALADFIHQQRLKQTEEDMFAHPYKYELDHFVPAETLLEEVKPFLPLQDVPCHFVTTLDQLVELNEKLLRCSEIAVDLEHHSYRSFLGLTCLMQISTRTEDFIVDVLELRSDMYILNESFTDPAIIKVFHGADSDIEWLQKDFGLYVVNMFDTHQASRILNLGRNSLDHLLRLYCSVESDKRFQLADWRIRPLPEEMIQYARADTHYLLYIYDKMRTELLNSANGQQILLQLVWQRSRDICLKKFSKPIFTDESYLELYQKQKRHLNTQQLAAFRLLFAWRDKMARQEDESTGYVLPNHMLLKISEELPKELQGIIACCNPVPPLVRQQINELSLLVQQGRETPLLKSEFSGKKKGPMPNPEKMENVLFGPHDASSHPAGDHHLDVEALPTATGTLFSDDDELDAPASATPVEILARATITIFNEPEEEAQSVSLAQQKARSILESFHNPFRMFLPAEDRGAHVSQAAKLDPNTKMFEISKRWKLVSLAQQEKEAKAKEEARQKKREERAAREQQKQNLKAKTENIKSAREQAKDEYNNKKRGRVASEPGDRTVASDKKRVASEPGDRTVASDKKRVASEPGDRTVASDKKRVASEPGDRTVASDKKRVASEPGDGTVASDKKRSKPPEEKKPQAPNPFTPFDYSKSDFKVFAGSSNVKSRAEYDPNKPPEQGKKNAVSRKSHQSKGSKSMSFTQEKSARGFRHSWPKR